MVQDWEDSRVRVAVNVRPLIEKEVLEGCEECIRVRPNEPDVVHTRDGHQNFAFDYVFGGGGRGHDQLYDKCARPLVEDVLRGFNAAVLAYGQTGSGKTYTMGTGTPDGGGFRGVAPTAVRELFDELAKADTESWTATVSFVELHREVIRDLLDVGRASSGTVSLRMVAGKGVCLAGAVLRNVRSVEDVEACLAEGSQSRATASTEMNRSSSRSHAVLTLTVEQTVPADDGQGTRQLYSRLHLVDLAGSERAKRTKAEGLRFREGVSINKGLLALGKVISALVDYNSGGANVHIPYRDSKLTRLLQDSLGGNSRTLMIACVSPADVNLDETLNTLRYATRAKKIRNKVSQNVVQNDDSGAAEVAALRRQLEQTRQELLLVRSADDSELHAQLLSCREENRNLRERLRECEADLRASREAATAAAAVCGVRTGLEDASVLDCGSDSTPGSSEDETGAAREGSGGLEDSRLGQVGGSADRRGLPAILSKELAALLVSPGRIGARDSADGSGALATEMEELEQQLCAKQTEMERMEQMVGRVAELQSNYEKHVGALEEEKERLRAKLQEMENSKDAVRQEERAKSRARLKELEQQISTLKSQLRETERLRREREGAEEQRQKLRADIVRIKQQKAGLARQMEQAARAHRDVVRHRDHEIAQLKKRDVRNAVKLQRLEQKEQQNAAILERKNREAEAAKRRLRDAMARLEGRAATSQQPRTVALTPTRAQPQLQPQPQPRSRPSPGAVIGQVDAYIRAREKMDELRLTVDVEQRERAKTAREAERLRNGGGDDGRLQDRILQHSARIREAQAELVDLQTNFEGPDADARRWGQIRTVAEAQAVLRLVFGMAVESKRLLKEAQGELTQQGSTVADEASAKRRRVSDESEEQAGAGALVAVVGSTPNAPLTPPAEVSTAAGSGDKVIARRRPQPQPQPQAQSVDSGSASSDAPSGDDESSTDAYDDLDDPEWILQEATHSKSARLRKRSGSSAGGRPRDLTGDEKAALELINEWRCSNGRKAVERLTVHHLREYLKASRSGEQSSWRPRGKAKATLLTEALSGLQLGDSRNSENVVPN